jgi:hypothetical protein
MSTQCYCRIMATTVLVFVFSFAPMVWGQGFPRGHRDALGPRFKAAPGYRQQPRRQDTGIDAVRRWNEIAINASGLDHTPVADGETRVFGEQIGPGRAGRAMAIVHIAIFDAVAAISGGYRSYTEFLAAPVMYRCMPRLHRRRTIRSAFSFLRKRKILPRHLLRICSSFQADVQSKMGWISGAAPQRPSSNSAQTMVRSIRSRA